MEEEEDIHRDESGAFITYMRIVHTKYTSCNRDLWEGSVDRNRTVPLVSF